MLRAVSVAGLGYFVGAMLIYTPWYFYRVSAGLEREPELGNTVAAIGLCAFSLLAGIIFLFLLVPFLSRVSAAPLSMLFFIPLVLGMPLWFVLGRFSDLGAALRTSTYNQFYLVVAGGYLLMSALVFTLFARRKSSRI